MTKTPKESFTEQVHIINHADLNGYKRLFGGTLMSWIDIVAAISARRYANANVTTVSIDNLHFMAPARANDIVVLCAKVTYTGRTSIEVCVDSYVENLDGSRKQINKAYVVMVALDENEKPIPVPELVPETKEEIQEQIAGERRRRLRQDKSSEKLAQL